MRQYFLTSMARIADFTDRPFERIQLDRSEWDSGDYVVGEILDSGTSPFFIEAIDGRAVEVLPGDAIVGAFGRRAATLEVVGDWRNVGDDLVMQTLTSAGVLGRCTSAAFPSPPMADVRYIGHVSRAATKCTMKSFVSETADSSLEAPVILIIGTSMDAGKTVAAKAIVRSLKRLGHTVAATKLTGVGRYRDVLAAGDAGADVIADFVDVGLPSTAVPPAEFESALRLLLARLAASSPDVVVAEAGASPLEPYNGEVAVRLLGDQVACTVLCASDPYAVVGVMEAFASRPDLIAGRATSTEAAIELVSRLCGVRALNMLDIGSHQQLDELLSERLAE